MTRLFLVPAAGTIFAAIAIAMSHGEQESDLYPILTTPTPPSIPTPPPSAREEPGNETEENKTLTMVRKYLMDLKEDGTFAVSVELRSQEAREPLAFDTLEGFLKTAAPEGSPRPVIRLFTTSDKVTKEDLEKVAAQLRERCEVVIQHQ